MEVISALPGISRADLAAFNRCRLFLGIIFLSELTTVDGHSLACDAWLGTRPRHTPFLWPYQPDPGPKSWRILRRLLANAFLDTHHKRVTKSLPDLILESPLGDWLPGFHWLQHSFNFFYSATTRKLYHTIGISYQIHSRLRQSRHRSQVYSAASDAFTTALPLDSIPVNELSVSGSILAFRGTKIAQQLEPLPPIPLTFQDYIACLPPWDCRLLDAVTLHDAPGLLEHLQSDQPLSIVSDGGAAGYSGSYGALVANKHRDLRLPCRYHRRTPPWLLPSRELWLFGHLTTFFSSGYIPLTHAYLPPTQRLL
jgi:hypothetical protein